MENRIPNALNNLLTAGQDAINGAQQYGAAIGLVHNGQVKLETTVTAVVTARDAHEAGKVLLRGQRKAVATAAKTGRAFLVLMRDTLKRTLGNRYSQAWDAAGFTGGTLEVPVAPDLLQPRLQAAQAYLLANPGAQIAPLDITAAQAGLLFNNLRDARGAVDTQKSVLAGLKTTRDRAVKKLRKTLRALINELAGLIEPVDERWLAFGLNKPGAKKTPDVPTNVRVTLLNNTAAELKWDRTPRAAHYRLFRRVVGVDPDFVAVSSLKETAYTLNDLPAGAQVQVALSAVNDGGESARSEVVTLTLPSLGS